MKNIIKFKSKNPLQQSGNELRLAIVNLDKVEARVKQSIKKACKNLDLTEKK